MSTFKNISKLVFLLFLAFSLSFCAQMEKKPDSDDTKTEETQKKEEKKDTKKVVTEAPPAPTGLEASVSDNSAKIKWIAVDTASSYIISVKGSSGDSDEKESSSAKCNIVNLIKGTTYTVTVIAVNEKGKSAASEPVVFDVEGEPTVVEGNTVATPSSFNASAGNTVVNLSWDSVDGASSYIVHFGISADKLDLDTGEIESTNIEIPNLENDKTYYFLIQAKKGETLSEPSEIIEATPKKTDIIKPGDVQKLKENNNGNTGQKQETKKEVKPENKSEESSANNNESKPTQKEEKPKPTETKQPKPINTDVQEGKNDTEKEKEVKESESKKDSDDKPKETLIGQIEDSLDKFLKEAKNGNFNNTQSLEIYGELTSLTYEKFALANNFERIAFLINLHNFAYLAVPDSTEKHISMFGSQYSADDIAFGFLGGIDPFITDDPTIKSINSILEFPSDDSSKIPSFELMLLLTDTNSSLPTLNELPGEGAITAKQVEELGINRKDSEIMKSATKWIRIQAKDADKLDIDPNYNWGFFGDLVDSVESIKLKLPYPFRKYESIYEERLMDKTYKRIYMDFLKETLPNDYEDYKFLSSDLDDENIEIEYTE